MGRQSHEAVGLSQDEKPRSLRHLAAPNRSGRPSALTRAAVEHHLITRDRTHLDFGCGLGQDSDWLNEIGYQSSRYDPYYFPEQPGPADVVTMSYVLSTIETYEERIQTLQYAWSLANHSLLISDNVDGGHHRESWSSRNVYVYRFTRNELKGLAQVALGYQAEWFESNKLVICKEGNQVKVWTKDEVEQLEKQLSQDWIAPRYANIRKYNTGDCYYFRVESRLRNIKNREGKLVKQLHLSGRDDIKWAMKGIKKRNMLYYARMNCIGLPYTEQLHWWKEGENSGICTSLRTDALLQEVDDELFPLPL